jgi:hypothetical protein
MDCRRLKLKKIWTYDCASQKFLLNNTGIKKLHVRKVFTNIVACEHKINVWRDAKDDYGNTYVYNIISLKSFWKIPKKVSTLHMKNKKDSMKYFKECIKNSFESELFKQRILLQKNEYTIETIGSN